VVFLKGGVVVGSLDPGTYFIDPEQLPFVENLLEADSFGSHIAVTDVFFVTVRPVSGIRITADLGQVLDPRTQISANVQMFGVCTLEVESPEELAMWAHREPQLATPEHVTEFVASMLLMQLGDFSTSLAQREWSLLQLASGELSAALSTEFAERASSAARPIGVAVPAFESVSMVVEREALEQVIAATQG
jgi:membrane protease subunit (stomatin/prohibitin family)